MVRTQTFAPHQVPTQFSPCILTQLAGFKYTQSADRMWRKNRQQTSGSSCLGHDINRNWPYQWDGPGSSTNPCAEDFRGSSQGDAPETKALSGFLQQVKNSQGLKLYIDYHSYSQLFMTRKTPRSCPSPPVRNCANLSRLCSIWLFLRCSPRQQ
jgi:hypothetical protein